ncbi:MAG: DNA polymerase III subunit delta, partial [Bacteroidales bacterium]|nr:DNA polymerase III subunit delta [Bacteroidales bacterium]
MRFRDIIGQKPLIERLIASAQAGRIAHAQLFSGPEGNQKLPLALAYAQFLNCRHKVTAADADLGGLSADSCGQCPSCVKFERLAHPDLHFFFPNNIGELVKKDAQSTDYLPLWREFGLKNRLEFSLNDWIEAMNIGQRQAIINIRDCHTLIEQLALKSCEADYRVVVLWMAEKISDTISSTLLKT